MNVKESEPAEEIECQQNGGEKLMTCEVSYIIIICVCVCVETQTLNRMRQLLAIFGFLLFCLVWDTHCFCDEKFVALLKFA